MNRAALLSLSHGDLIALVQAQQAQIEAQAQQISVLTARIVELEGRLAAPAKTPDNSSIPPSKGQKSNLPDRPKKPRGGHPGVVALYCSAETEIRPEFQQMLVSGHEVISLRGRCE